jgi:hypothetical protein
MNYSAAGLWLSSIFVAAAVNAAPVLDTLPTVDTVRNRLELTPDQEGQLRPLFEKRLSELRQTKTLLEQATTSQQRRELLRAAKAAGDAFNRQVESVLTPSQQHEWREMRSELRIRAKERAEEKLDSG